MPNWCNNHLSVQGPRINEVLSAIAGENGAMDLQKIIPMPEAFIDTESWTKEDVALSCANDDLSRWEDMPWVKSGEVTTTRQLAARHGFDFEEAMAYGKKLLHNMEEYGATTWYDWCCKNWGCKWNTRDSWVDEHFETSAAVMFYTPWGPPSPVIRALARKFPDHSFNLTYADIEGGSAGILEVKGGEIIREENREVSYEDYDLEDIDDCAVTAIEETDGASRILDGDDLPF
jgi:Ferredoxin-like domain in Api92-like protein